MGWFIDKRRMNPCGPNQQPRVDDKNQYDQPLGPKSSARTLICFQTRHESQFWCINIAFGNFLSAPSLMPIVIFVWPSVIHGKKWCIHRHFMTIGIIASRHPPFLHHLIDCDADDNNDASSQQDATQRIATFR